MGASDCITVVMSYAQQYNMHHMQMQTQPQKHICIPKYKHIINKIEPKANILTPCFVGEGQLSAM